MKRKISILVHGGAGTLIREKYSAKELMDYENTLEEALLAGYKILKDGGSSLDAVQRAVIILEDSPLFNAGKGSVFNAEGFHELDASLMEGAYLQVGGVTGATKIKNPIVAARLVMEKSPHCLFAGEGADRFAKSQGLEMVDQEYFFTPYRWEQWRSNFQQGQKVDLDHSDQNRGSDRDQTFGTVGAVALDEAGTLSSATSTGGLSNKAHGRVSDSAIIGAGTYANNQTCAISTTGKGDYFIRNMTAGDISHLMEYRNMDLKSAAELCLQKIKDQGGEGGIIGLDKEGNGVMVKNTTGMFRGMIRPDGSLTVEIF